ncbi:uncharacterized protein (TIGR02246 family) [Microvirga flocculans]|uniref:Uncharacterized protein (TIGR02246 family) n=1 Tax=Microvirga flocculans TaxID=217168 RepID=A0A7W6IGK8_9HYPH|nr:SgcJ/EcaC family oxidoreductase [Microvirga flocculans]MBB4041119.1 uncharacterized protein (TIGR02246 family) [Microvirga flocculans]
MANDEIAIRHLVQVWLEASRKGEVSAVLELMTDDVVFMVPGQAPFGKQAFAAMAARMKDFCMSGSSDVQELRIMGDWAYLRNYLDVTMTPPGGEPVRRSGYTLTILRKEKDGQWRIARDANLLS